jgi:hypothetical protein
MTSTLKNTIEIDDTKRISDINEQFVLCFPFLQLRFYKKPHAWQVASAEKDYIDEQAYIGDIRSSHLGGVLRLNKKMKTGTLEQAFSKRFGLYVQVFRHHGFSWIQTVGTDELTLQEQNEIGRSVSEELLHGSNWIFQHEKDI